MKDKTFIELVEMKDEEVKDWDAWASLVKKKAPEAFRQMNYPELEDFYKRYSGDGLDPWWDAWDKAVCSNYPFEQILSRLDTIETSLNLLLKEHEGEPAKITIGQLNRLKNGL